MIDRAAQALYHLAKKKIFLVTIRPFNTISGSGNLDPLTMFRIRTLLDKSYSPEWILEADIML